MIQEKTEPNPANCSVIGLGAMGSAVAERLVNSGVNTFIWNRTASKSAPLVSAGATAVATATEACLAAPLILIVLSDMKTASQIVSALKCSLSGRTVVNFCSGTREDAENFEQLVRDCGGQCLHGSITTYPRNVGHPDSCFFYSGDAEAYQQHQGLLAGLSGDALFLSRTDSLALGAAVTIQAFVAMGAFYEAVAVGSRLGADTSQLVTNLRKTSRFLFLDAIDDAANRIDLQDFSGEQATIDTHAAHVAGLLQTLQARGMEPRLLNAFMAAIETAQRLGYGPDDISATSHVL